jgi:hypothetical protein
MKEQSALKAPIVIDEPIHDWFGLTYARYLVVPRSVLQSMPIEWQHRLVEMLNELNAALPVHYSYEVRRRGRAGAFSSDPLNHYRHRGPVTREELDRYTKLYEEDER